MATPFKIKNYRPTYQPVYANAIDVIILSMPTLATRNQ
jgi:hypothetical protein